MPSDFAVIRGNRMYTLKPYRDPWGRPDRGLPYVGYRDGDRCGFYRTKKDFLAFIERDALDLMPQQLASIEAEQRSTAEGLRLLDQCVRLNRLKGIRRIDP